MTLSLVKPSGWSFGELLTSAQMEALDASQAQAIDGTGGGTYTPSAKIIINGQGLQVNNLTVTGLLTLNGNTTIGNSGTDHLTVIATSTFSAPVTLNDTLAANSTSDFFANVTVHTSAFFLAGGDAQLGNDATKALTIGATTTLNAPLTSFDSVDIWGDLTCHSATTFTAAGDVQLGNDTSKSLSIGAALINALSFDQVGRVPFSNGGTTPNHDATLQPGSGQVWHVNPAASDTWTYTLGTDGVGDGDWMLFFSGAGNEGVLARGAVIKIASSSAQNFTFPMGKNSQFVLYVRSGGAWWQALSSTFI